MAQSQDTEVDGVIKHIKFDENRPSSQAAQAILKDKLELRDDDEFILYDKIEDQLGFTHAKYQQYHKGLKVEFGNYIIHSKKNQVQTMNGDYFPIDEEVNIAPTLSEEQALNAALNHIGADIYMWESADNEAFAIQNEPTGTYFPTGELVIVKQFFKERQDPDLAYKFDIYAEKPVSRDYIYVNAHTGEVIFENAIIKHCSHGTPHNHIEEVSEEPTPLTPFLAPVAAGTAATRYSGNRTIETSTTSGGHRLRDNTRGNGINTLDCNTGTSYNQAVDFVDNDNSWTANEWNNNQKDNAALDAHWGAEMTYDYFVAKHNRNSYNGSGATINSYIHYDSNYDNAFWDGSRMTYGDGNTFDALTSLDVAAHEIGHAVCTYTANLVYQDEPGALNESFSDIWAACVENYAAPEKDLWLIGEDIGQNYGPLRNMANPNARNAPDTYQGNYWVFGSEDYGGVHTNSSVLNHCFHILTAGKSGTNDSGNSYSVTGLGFAKAEAIFYRAESVYLSTNSQYMDARNACIDSATDLYGANSDEVCQTKNAFYAIAVGASATCGGGTGPSCSDGVQNGTETGVDCGGSCAPCSTPCNGTDVTISFTFDNYPEETAWTITDASGATVASGGTYGSQADGSTLTISQCLAGGCYDFTITDAYGDGICCSYGNGSYSIAANGSTLISGGQFASSETKNFCLGAPAPTCNDGIQNQGESGVDCGGPCTACATCNDGIQNQGESGVDCGGPCTACPTCNDGIQNQGESGVDCGGPCTACATCNDGIQNQGETGVDCGGPCAPCSSGACIDIDISLTFDNYPEETAWTITDASGATVASGGTYGSQADGSTLNLSECLPAGCYDFTITDAYGDGICCSYGNDAYSISSNGTTLVSGGQFASSETKNFCLTPPPSCTDVVVSITFDNYPEETAWTLTDANGTTIGSGGTYGNQADGSTLNLTGCLETGCYDFTMTDTYGDGICCLEGNGSYTISANGTTLTSGGQFTTSETKSFCVGVNTIYGITGEPENNEEEESIEISDESESNIEKLLEETSKVSVFPNPTKDVINLVYELTNEETTINVYNSLGQLVMTQKDLGSKTVQLDVAKLQAGNYFISIHNSEKVLFSKFIKH